MTPHVLILGGTSEARLLAERLSGRADVRVTLSLAGRTQAPLPQSVPTRVGGFGGVGGLVHYLRQDHVTCLVDATHPFAQQISHNAHQAADRTGTTLIALQRAPWTAEPGDRWTRVADAAAAVDALGPNPRRVFVTIGRQGLAALLTAPQHRYWIRTVDPVMPPLDLPHAHYLVERGPFAEQSEHAMLSANRIEMLIAKNSGGAATYGKIAAARALGIQVVLIERAPARNAVLAANSVDGLFDHVVAALAPGIERGV
jgi:precorrin-6A/cobalt-precorrin-6A reductase